MVSDSDDDDFRGMLSNDNGIGKPLQHETLRSASPSRTWDRCKRHHLLLREVKICVHGLLELRAKPRAFLFVPRSSLRRFLGGSLKNTNCSRQALGRRSRMRRMNSARSTSLAVPSFIWSRRRRIWLIGDRPRLSCAA
jgi:hypothetical protein